jgi:hypothetical protein
MPENNAMVTSGLLSDLSNEPVDAEIGTKIRAFGISGFSNAYVVQTPQPEEQSSQLRRRFNALHEFREIPPPDEGTGQRNRDVTIRQIALPGCSDLAGARV